jgi:putative membrane protein
MHVLLHLVVLALTIVGLSRILPSVHVKNIGTAFAVAFVFSVLNFFLGWLIRAALFVPAILTLGLLFLFVPLLVNTVLLWLTDRLMKSFEIKTLGGLLLSAAVITLVNGVFYAPLFQSVWQGDVDDSGQPGVHTAPASPRWI